MESKKNLKASQKGKLPKPTPKRRRTKKQNDIAKILAKSGVEDRPFNPKLFQCLMEEFLSSFIVIGYNQSGEPIVLTSAKDQQQMDALHTSLQRFIAMFMSGGHQEPEVPDEEM